MASPSDDLRRIFLGPTLFRIDTVIAGKLVPILYGTGLVAILVWAINQLFSSFGRSFGDGLWGLVEIAVFGLLWLLILRVACEVALVFFRSHQSAVESVRATRMSATLLEDVREAIHDLAEDDAGDGPRAPDAPPAATRPSSEVAPTDLPQRGPVVRRTAKRTPPSAPPGPPSDTPDQTS